MVKLTLLGSIISNLLLVMGSAFVAGGVIHPMQHFNQQGIQVNTGLLIVSGKQMQVVCAAHHVMQAKRMGQSCCIVKYPAVQVVLVG